MHIKRRGNRAMLYRSSWVPKGANGNTHGYSVQTFVASTPLDAEALPPDLAEKLTTDEAEFLETKIFHPARQAVQQRARAAELREVDPIWRLDEATRLTLEAAERSELGSVPNARVVAVQAALSRVRTITQPGAAFSGQAGLNSGIQVPHNGQSKSDPLSVALIAIKAARDAVLAGHYRSAPAEGVRNTHPYKLWADIFEAIEGSNGNSLMRALQAKGFVKTRQK